MWFQQLMLLIFELQVLINNCDYIFLKFVSFCKFFYEKCWKGFKCFFTHKSKLYYNNKYKKIYILNVYKFLKSMSLYHFFFTVKINIEHKKLIIRCIALYRYIYKYIYLSVLNLKSFQKKYLIFFLNNSKATPHYLFCFCSK